MAPSLVYHGLIRALLFLAFNGNNLPHQLLLATRQKTKLRNAVQNNMSTDIKLSKAQISKIIQSSAFLGSLLSKIRGLLMTVAVPLANKKYFRPIRNNSCCFSYWYRNIKENTWFWNNNFSNFKWSTEWYFENCISSCGLKCFTERSD